MSSARFRINEPHVLHQTIDNEAVIINLDTGNYYSLLKSGADVWSAVERGAGISEIVAALARKYKAVEKVLEDSVVKFVEQLQTEGLIEALHEANDSDNPPTAHEETSAAPQGPFEPPVLEKYEDMQDLILLDPIHEVDEEKGWPHARRPGKPDPKP